MLRTTLGQLLVNEALPEDMRNYGRVLDKKGSESLFSELADKHPERYAEIAQKLMNIGRRASYNTGSMSFALRHLQTAKAAKEIRLNLHKEIQGILKNPYLLEDQKNDAIIAKLQEAQKPLVDAVYKESLDEDNPLAQQVASGAKGNPTQLNSLRGADLLYVDHRDRPVPIPVLRNYSEGLSPAEWFAASFGARKGLVDVKRGTADAGYYNKVLNRLAHRLTVIAEDDDQPQTSDTPRGLPVDTLDRDNVGAFLAAPAGGYQRNTRITPKIMQELHNQGINQILARSPTVGGPASGVYSRDLGIRERGGLSPLGDMVGMAAAQALGEKASQSALSSKHSGGIAGAAKAVSGFDLMKQLVEIPKTFKGGAAHSQVDGTVSSIIDAPAGGKYVIIDGQRHYVSQGFDIHVKPGDSIEAGDVLSEGIPNPAEIVKHKGIGEGRRYFTQQYQKSYQEAGLSAHRRNVELISRGLIDHVEMDDEHEDHLPGDVVSYSQLEKSWQPRLGTLPAAPSSARGKYLEQPVLHYSIGTKVRPSVVKNLETFGVKQVQVHDKPPPFHSRMIRGVDTLQHDPDWMTRMYSSHLEKGLLDSVHTGASSDLKGTSFVPAMAAGTIGKGWPPKG
jgi:DNA-directed RNA polymerase subunit beta'